MRDLKAFLSAAALTSLSLCMPSSAFADGVSLILSNPIQIIGAGQTVTFDATVTALAGNTADVFLNADNSNITDAGSVFTLDDSDFFNNFPLSLTATGAGDSFTGALFTVTNHGSVAEAYAGIFNLLGGANGSSSDTLATVHFSSPAVAAVPESSSWQLLTAGFLSLAFFCRRPRWKA